MAENSKISQIKLPNGSTYDIEDNTSGYITGITSSDVTGALGFTPYNSTNPNGYTTNTGTITSVKTTAGAHTTINVTSGAANFNVPTKTSHLTNDSGFLTSYTETDPTVPAWAKAESKPSYTFSEIGSTPTTLSGYGITNAYTKTEVDGLVSGVLHYKGTKASVANLPTTGNTTGDVWHITADGSEYAWDGSVWQELGTAVDLSGYLLSSDIAAWAKASTKPTYTASEVGAMSTSHAANAITSTDISNWNAKVSDDKTWNGVSLSKTTSTPGANTTTYIPYLTSISGTGATLMQVVNSPTANSIVRYDGSAYLYSTTPSANDNSTKVATTAYVDAVIPTVPTTVSSFTNDAHYTAVQIVRW